MTHFCILIQLVGWYLCAALRKKYLDHKTIVSSNTLANNNTSFLVSMSYTALGINGGKWQLPPVLPPRKGSLAAKNCRQQLIIFLQKKYVINQQE